MKNQLRRLLVTIGLSAVLGSSLLNAQTSGKIGAADVPFSFRIADRVLPPGSYTVTARANGLMELWNTDTQQGVMVMTGENKSGHSDPKLVFNRYGDRYFLSQVWFGNEDAGRILTKGHLEKEIAGVGGNAPGSLASIRIK
ncbi:MAG TPA: hypothetical protein VIX89_00085 [Bryobacteraceae bacterium]